MRGERGRTEEDPMRPYISHLDTEAMPWQSRVAGAYTKLLSTDPDNGARTALQHLVPDEGYEAPKVAHYHHSDEELLILDGKLSFDSKTYLGRLGYCFHPARTVHGFKSSVPEETWFLSRHSEEMVTKQVPEPRQQSYYSVADVEPDRGLAVLVRPEDGNWEKDPRGAEVLDLGSDPKTGEGSRFMRVPAGSGADLRVADAFYQEIYVLEGGLTAQDGTAYNRGAYSFCPPGEPRPHFTKSDGALVYVNFGVG